MAEQQFIPLNFIEYSQEQMLSRAEEFSSFLRRRRSVRDFSDRYIPPKIIEDCLQAAAAAPSGANCQPWHFCIVSDRDIKRKIRLEAEKAERDFYTKKAPQKWLDDLRPLGTNYQKPFLQIAPYLIVVFSQRYRIAESGQILKNYYVTESVGIAVGFLIAAIHNAGLVTVPYTPAPMGFLNKILNRPENERPFCILPVGYPAKKPLVLVISRKSFKQFVSFFLSAV